MRRLSWTGIPRGLRARAWRLFLDYEPVIADQSAVALARKRADYFDCRDRLFGAQQQMLWTSAQRDILSQVLRDLPRMQTKLLRDERVSAVFQHVLFVYAVRHPASEYVQGMNDILFVFFLVFLAERYEEVGLEDIAAKSSVDEVSDEELRAVEADSFWCFSRFLDCFQDFYTKEQPGLYRMIEQLQMLMKKTDGELCSHLENENIQFNVFAFRWMNCLLVREFRIDQLLRIWDLLLSEPNRVSMTLVYICAAMISYVAPELMNLKQCELMEKIKSIPPEYWDMEKIDIILAQSFVYEKSFLIQKKF